VTAHDVPHRKENCEQGHYNEKATEQLAVAQHELEVAFVIPWHKRVVASPW
jgi:hypothetical protein